jgi:glycyl-tRNA synthetase
VLRTPEYEHSKYYFEIADVDRLRQMMTVYEAEAEAALAAGLIVPAYDYVLKCSHTFNVLDTRGAIGVTERQAAFGRVRVLARKVAEAYLEQRKQLEYPWLKESGQPSREAVSRQVSVAYSPIVNPQSLLLEIGVEELPAADVDTAIAQLKELTPKLLAVAKLTHGEVRVFGTPRRLAVLVDDLAPRQPDSETVVKGPPAARAFTAGLPTPAAEGFARGKACP